MIGNATSGAGLEAQNIILRRIALEGDVVPSRVPAPLNITQIGGYLNLLTHLNETAMRSQVLAGILGVAGPPNPAGWVSSNPPFAFRMIANDRPSGAAQATLPTVVPVRGDFAHAFLAALQTVHDRGCSLPLLGTPSVLPTAVLDPTRPFDPLLYLGRVLLLAPATALNDPSTDAIVLARAAGTTEPYRVALRSNGGNVSVPAGNYDALKRGTSGFDTVVMTGAKLVFLDPILAEAGFYPTSLASPSTPDDVTWASYRSIAGLVPGTTRLGDELAAVYSWTDVTASVFAAMTTLVWNGTTFAL